jgi:hypothetical protein
MSSRRATRRPSTPQYGSREWSLQLGRTEAQRRSRAGEWRAVAGAPMARSPQQWRPPWPRRTPRHAPAQMFLRCAARDRRAPARICYRTSREQAMPLQCQAVGLGLLVCELRWGDHVTRRVRRRMMAVAAAVVLISTMAALLAGVLGWFGGEVRDNTRHLWATATRAIAISKALGVALTFADCRPQIRFPGVARSIPLRRPSASGGPEFDRGTVPSFP